MNGCTEATAGQLAFWISFVFIAIPFGWAATWGFIQWIRYRFPPSPNNYY